MILSDGEQRARQTRHGTALSASGMFGSNLSRREKGPKPKWKQLVAKDDIATKPVKKRECASSRGCPAHSSSTGATREDARRQIAHLSWLKKIGLRPEAPPPPAVDSQRVRPTQKPFPTVSGDRMGRFRAMAAAKADGHGSRLAEPWQNGPERRKYAVLRTQRPNGPAGTTTEDLVKSKSN